MRLECQASRTMPCAPAAVFALLVDPLRFPATFAGYGPISAIRSITVDAPLAVGTNRLIHNADGSTLTETITVLDAPTHHAYTLSGFRAPFSWLVARGDADWTVADAPPASRVCWRYSFQLSHEWVYPIAAVLLRWFMARAMRRCLDRMAGALAIDPVAAVEAA